MMRATKINQQTNLETPKLEAKLEDDIPEDQAVSLVVAQFESAIDGLNLGFQRCVNFHRLQA